MPSKEFMSSYSAGAANAPEETGGSSLSIGRRTARVKPWFGEVGTFVGQLANDLTFNYLDEISSFGEYYIGRPLGFGETPDHLKTREEIRQYYEESLKVGNEQNPISGWGGTITSFFVPVGWAATSAKSLTAGRVALAGGAYGGLAGAGAAQPGERLEGGLYGAGAGLVGGYILGAYALPAIQFGAGKVINFLERGKSVDLAGADKLFETPELKLGDTPTSVTPKVTPNPIGLDTPEVPVKPVATTFDTLEDGALLTSKELLGDPAAARKAVAKRIGKMSETDAAVLIKKIEQAEIDGRVFDNPHYKSLLRVDLSETPLTPQQLTMAAELFEEATEELAKKAGIGKRTVKDMDKEVGEELKKGLTLSDLEESFNKSQEGFVQTRVAQHVMVSAAAKVVRLRAEMLPRLLKGEEGVRETLAEELTDAAYRLTYARGIMSNAGRALGILSHGTKANMVDVVDNVENLTLDQVRERVRASLEKLGDQDLSEMLNRVRTMSDAEKFQRIIMNEAEAEAFTWRNRMVNSLGLFLRSNALTPITGAINVVGFVANDFFRNHIAARVAANSLEKSGRMSEAVALRFSEKASRAVWLTAQKRGLKAFMDRVNWELWTDVERIAAVGWGSGKVAAKARLKRSSMLNRGYAPSAMREFEEQPRLMVRDTQGFNDRIEIARVEGGALANLVYHMQRARAVTANTVDALGGASMKVFTAAVDDWGREFVRYKETLAQATRFAVQEAGEFGIPIERVGPYVEARAAELADLPTAEIMTRVEDALVSDAADLRGEAAFLRDLEKLVETEADQVLFMDGPKTAFGKASAHLLAFDKIGLVFPYVRTPIRLFEQGVINYGPLGKRSKEIRDIIKAGGLEAELAKARVEAGTQVFHVGMVLGLAGGITATNGGFTNSANLDAGPPNRLNLPGGGFVEISRLDPFSFTVGMGAVLGQALRDGFAAGTEYDQTEAIKAALNTTVVGTYDAILSKAYMKSLQELLENFDFSKGMSLDSLSPGIEKLFQNATGRLIPLGGVSRQINETFRSSAIESVGWVDTLLRHIPGAGWGMAPRVDPLGDEVKSRTFGFNVGNSELTEGEQISPVKAQLRDLGININTLRKSDPDGFELTSDELSEVRKIRGKEATNDDGLTMPEALEELFADPWFQGLPTKDQKRKEVVKTMAEFNKPAWEILAERNDNYASKKSYTRSLQDYIAEGLTKREAERNAEQDVLAEGLPLPQ